MKRELLLTCLTLTSCIKKDPTPAFTLPDATQTGAQTMGFRIDGRVWQNFGRSCTFFGCTDNELLAYYSPQYGQFQLSASLNSTQYNESFGLEIRKLYSTGTYLSEDAVGQFNNPEDSFVFIDSGKRYFLSPRPSSTTIIITRFDTVNKIISGSFSGNLQTKNTPHKNTSITDGRFDVSY